MNKERKNADHSEELLATEVIGQARKDAMRWFIAWLATLAALIGTNAAWILAFCSK